MTALVHDRAPRRGVRRRLALGRRQVLAFRPSWSWALGVLRSFATSFVALAVSLKLLPGTQVTRGALSVAGLSVTFLALSALLRPLLARLTVLTGLVGLFVVGVLAQSVILFVAIELVPTVVNVSPLDVVLASYAASLTAAALNWVVDTSSDEVFYGQLLGRAVRSTPAAGSLGPGLLVVQLDGVGEPVLRQALASGAVPTVQRWVRTGSHRLRRWHTGVPATTPAGQAVLLHGDTRTVPAYRWFDKELGREVVVSRFGDAADVQQKISDGRGLLADGGASVSNLWNGDAPTRVMTISEASPTAVDASTAGFATMRAGFVRSLLLFVGQVVTEAYQARRQRVRDVVPRVARGGSFLFLRGITTVLLRDASVAVVAEQMTRGVPVVYVDLVDYDEVAHHAGPTRPESLRTLENLDRVLGFLARLGQETPRRYEVAVVSDHGQAQGSTFLQLAGKTLEDVVQDLVGVTDAQMPAAERAPGTPTGMLAAGLAGSGRSVLRAAQGLANRREKHVATAPCPLLVLASGSLAHVYRTDVPGRLTGDDLERLHPGLVAGLVAHPQVGFVLTRRADGAVEVHGSDGRRVLSSDGAVLDAEGEDPLAGYGPWAARDVVALEGKEHVGDLVVLGAFDDVLGEVVAFEELVGSHGGMGGGQTEAFLLHPASWDVPRVPLDGPTVHEALVGRLEQLGLRTATTSHGAHGPAVHPSLRHDVAAVRTPSPAHFPGMVATRRSGAAGSSGMGSEPGAAPAEDRPGVPS